MLLRGEGKVPFPIPFNNGVAVHHLRGELVWAPNRRWRNRRCRSVQSSMGATERVGWGCTADSLTVTVEVARPALARD